MKKQSYTGKIRAVFFLLLAMCAFACGEAKAPDAIAQAKKLYGEKIEFPAEYFSIVAEGKTFSIDEELAKPLKIVTYLDKNSCSECALKILLHWSKLLQELSGNSIGFIPVIYPSDTSELIDALEKLQIGFPLLYDIEDKFLDINKLRNALAINRTFLLDSDNKIIVIGEPLASEKLWQVYKNTLKDRL